jgi:UDP-glucose 4-epimerase
MKFLLTGATGFIGSNLQAKLLQNHQVYSITRKPPPTSHDDRLTWLQADLSKPDSISGMPASIDAVVYLAQSRAYRRFPGEAQDIFNVNVRSTLALAEHARISGVRTFVFASTANVYRLSPERISEEWVVEPTSFYARTKRMAEMLMESYADFFNCTVLRLFTVYGPCQTETLVSDLIERVRFGRPIQVQGQHGFKTSPVYVGDVKDVILRLLEREKFSSGFEVFNVGGDEMLGIRELAVAIGEALNVSPVFDYTEENEPTGWMANNAKLKTTLSLETFLSIRDGIKRVLA